MGVEVEVEGGSLELRYEGCFQLGCFAYRRCTKLTWGRLWFGAPQEGGAGGGTKYRGPCRQLLRGCCVEGLQVVRFCFDCASMPKTGTITLFAS